MAAESAVGGAAELLHDIIDGSVDPDQSSFRSHEWRSVERYTDAARQWKLHWYRSEKFLTHSTSI